MMRSQSSRAPSALGLAEGRWGRHNNGSERGSPTTLEMAAEREKTVVPEGNVTPDKCTVFRQAPSTNLPSECAPCEVPEAEEELE